jgi:hypothetical protein
MYVRAMGVRRRGQSILGGYASASMLACARSHTPSLQWVYAWQLSRTRISTIATLAELATVCPCNAQQGASPHPTVETHLH